MSNMYSGLAGSGGILAIFGTFLVLIDFYIPLGTSGFGIPILIIGVVMTLVGLWRPEPTPVEAEAGKKFCWYCMTQIPVDSKECSNCSLPQHEAAD